jgi:predicted dehydrogenase
MAVEKVKVGIIGCGNISGAYLGISKKFKILDVVACADLIPARAKEAAKKFKIKKACTVQKLLADREIEIVMNLTIPNAHFSVAMAALESGKNVHNEKPLAITRAEGKKLLKIAREKGLRVGGAPDTFMGGGFQTCRKLIDDGEIGDPIGAIAFMVCHGHESWHPDPEFYYKVGGGPMFDMGPYYITALVNLLGPIRRVTGSARISFPERLITSAPKNGTKIKVDVPTHVVGVMDFKNGAVGSIITSFDVWAAHVPRIEIFGSKGSLSVPDPNGFGGPVSILRSSGGGWQEVPLTHGYNDNNRSIGVADMAYAIRSGRKHRANGELTYHVLDVMHAFHDASKTGVHILLKSTCERPAALPTGLKEGTLDK